MRHYMKSMLKIQMPQLITINSCSEYLELLIIRTIWPELAFKKFKKASKRTKNSQLKRQISFIIFIILESQFQKCMSSLSKYINLQLDMYSEVIGGLSAIFLIYALVAYVRRKVTKPDYTGKNVWITGASSGLGQYLTYEFNRCGAYVIISARNVEELNRVKNGCSQPQRAEVVKLDMTKYKDVETVTKEVIDKLQKQGKTLDIVVQNAGQSMRSQFIHYAFENHLALFDVNVNGPYKHLKCVVPHMIKNKSGKIIGITSQSGKLSPAYRTSYSGSKAAFIGILDSIRSQLRPYGIRVCNIMPGYIKTNISKNALGAVAGEKFGQNDGNIGQGMEPQDFAKQAVAAAYNNENQVSIANKWTPIIGIVLRNLCPDFIFRMLLRNAKTQSKAPAGVKKE